MSRNFPDQLKVLTVLELKPKMGHPIFYKISCSLQTVLFFLAVLKEIVDLNCSAHQYSQKLLLTHNSKNITCEQ